MKILLLFAMAVFAVADVDQSSQNVSSSGLSEMINNLYKNKNKCPEHLRTCRSMTVGLGIFAVVMLMLNIVQMVWFNRVGIRDGLRGVAARLSRNPPQQPHGQLVNEDDDLDFSRPSAPQF